MILIMKRKAATHTKTPERKSQIIAAALACFNAAGVTETSISDICKASGTSIGSIYHHFKGKEQLAAAVYLDGLATYQDGFLAELESKATAKSGITAVVDYHLNWIVRFPDWARYLFKQRHAVFSGESKAKLKDRNKWFLKRNSTWFRVHIEAGTLKALPPDIFISILMGPCQMFSKQYLFGQAYSEIDLASNEIATAVWQALKADLDP